MESEVQRLSQKVFTHFQSLDASARLLVAVAGIPGSGKTSLATHVIATINTLYHASQHTLHPHFPTPDESHPDPNEPDVAITLPLDGYHLTRAQLSALPNADEAIFRRGAAFTFDADAYFALVTLLRKPLEASTRTVRAPSFDHAIKDPVEDDIPIHPTTRIVLLEGNYVALNQKPWSDAARLMDEVWFVAVSEDVAAARLVKRHVAAGIAANEEDAAKRVWGSDMRNGREIVEGLLKEVVTETVGSVEDAEWKTEDLKRVEEEQEKESSAGVDGGQGAENEIHRVERMDSVAEMAAEGVGL